MSHLSAALIAYVPASAVGSIACRTVVRFADGMAYIKPVTDQVNTNLNNFTSNLAAMVLWGVIASGLQHLTVSMFSSPVQQCQHISQPAGPNKKHPLPPPP